MVYDLLRALSGDRALCHRPRRDARHHRQVRASVEALRPHGFVVRFWHARQSRQTRPSHPAPNVRDDRETPLWRMQDGAGL